MCEVVNGKRRVTGNKQLLKASQSYPRGFGEAVVRLWLEVHLLCMMFLSMVGPFGECICMDLYLSVHSR